MPAGILAIQPMDIASRGGQFIAVSLSNRKVLIFEDKHIVDWVRKKRKIRKKAKCNNNLVLFKLNDNELLKLRVYYFSLYLD